MLSQAGITKQDQEAHPNEVLKVIDFYQANADSHEDIWEKFKNAQVDKHKESKKNKKHLKRFSHDEPSPSLSTQNSGSVMNSNAALDRQGSNNLSIDISRQQTVLNKDNNNTTSSDYEPTYKKDIDLEIDFGSAFNLSETLDKMMNFDDLDLSLSIDTPILANDEKEDVCRVSEKIESVENLNNKKKSSSHLNIVNNFDNLELSNEKIDVYKTEKKTQSTILPTSDNINRVSTKPATTATNLKINSGTSSPVSIASDKSKPNSVMSKQSEYPQLRQRKVDEESVDIINQLKDICHETNPESLFTNLEKIGQGASAIVYIGNPVASKDDVVAIKQMDLEKQSKKDLILNEIQVMKQYKHKNIVNFIDGYFWNGRLWVFIII
ncbi:hypothetical protein PIROE2DRAFT_6249 [Piromyces sp. E2]|nr:hypothetical protein PIROE2DRAFT_6249 [Piromyces sp. E2]|eukprot:OUM66521.1 hypothetical protein PIROE2DRAFT_6249 [Piromyces sp. E2]